jgi:hypothetical protein
MSVRYRLPCKCGQTVLVERSQAGLSVICSCGTQLEVPTIRGLNALEPVHDAPEKIGWTAQSGLLLIGALIVLIAGGAAAIRVARLPVDPYDEKQIDQAMAKKAAEIDGLEPGKVLEGWQEFRGGLYIEDVGPELNYRKGRAAYNRWTWVLAGVAAAGLLFCVIVLATGAGQPKRSAPAKQRRAT